VGYYVDEYADTMEVCCFCRPSKLYFRATTRSIGEPERMKKIEQIAISYDQGSFLGGYENGLGIESGSLTTSRSFGRCTSSSASTYSWLSSEDLALEADKGVWKSSDDKGSLRSYGVPLSLDLEKYCRDQVSFRFTWLRRRRTSYEISSLRV
jgi:hypothetical protein